MGDKIITDLIVAADKLVRKGALDTLAKDTKDWATEEQDEAKQLLLWWFTLADKGRSRADVIAAMIEYFGQQYEVWLRLGDAEVQRECVRNPPSRLERFWGDPCKEGLFERRAGVGHQMVYDFKCKLIIFQSGEPNYLIWRWYREYRYKKDILRQMWAEAVSSGIAGGFANASAWTSLRFRGGGPRRGYIPAQGGEKRNVRSAAGRPPRAPKILGATEGTKVAAAKLAQKVAASVLKGSGSGPKPSKPLYRIAEGVRRTTIARDVGKSTIDAVEVGSGKKIEIPLDQLYVQPSKGTIPRDERYVNLVRSIAEKGQTTSIEVIPITQEASEKLVPLRNVQVVKTRSTF